MPRGALVVPLGQCHVGKRCQSEETLARGHRLLDNFTSVVYPHLSHSPDDHHRFRSCFGTGMRDGTTNTPLSFNVHPRTEDPQLVAEPWRGSKPWLGDGKQSKRTHQWTHGSIGIHPRPSQPRMRRTPTANGSGTFDCGMRQPPCRKIDRAAAFYGSSKARVEISLPFRAA